MTNSNPEDADAHLKESQITMGLNKIPSASIQVEYKNTIDVEKKLL